MSARPPRRKTASPLAILTLACAGSLLVACGGMAPPAAQSPATAPPAAGSTSAPESSPATPAPPSPPAPGAPMPAVVESSQPAAAEAARPTNRKVERAEAEVDFERARMGLEASAGDCAAACRALASMERATVHLCALADGANDRRRCDDARSHLKSSRSHVRSTCGSCPDGPSLDDGASP